MRIGMNEFDHRILAEVRVKSLVQARIFQAFLAAS